VTPRRRDDDEIESFDPEFDDDVFAAPAVDEDAPRPRAARRSRAKKNPPAKPLGRARRIGRILGAAALVGAIAVFVISFIAGLGGSGDRITGDALSGGEELDRIGPRVRVEVLNASGVAGLARQATEHLRDRGFDVVAFGNAGSSDFTGTVVLARTTDVEAARDVAAALGTDSVAVEPDPQLYLDVTVLLGRDWPPAAVAAPEERGFFGWFRSLF
jgi:hypothetical protein